MVASCISHLQIAYTDTPKIAPDRNGTSQISHTAMLNLWKFFLSFSLFPNKTAEAQRVKNEAAPKQCQMPPFQNPLDFFAPNADRVKRKRQHHGYNCVNQHDLSSL
jgi:hypothetical protein